MYETHYHHSRSAIKSSLLTVAISVPLLCLRLPLARPGITHWSLRMACDCTTSPPSRPCCMARRVCASHVRRDPARHTHGAQGIADIEQLAVIDGPDFANGVIEAEIAGALASEAAEGARGFVGIAFRLRNDMKTYNAFYLRPTNGRAEDQERRNHAVQSISHPDWPWSRLRKETPSRYESYVDLVPGVWTSVKIEVRGDRARLYVHGHEQPTLIVNDVKSGAGGTGAVALWLGPGTVAHFRNLTVEPLSVK